MKNNNSFYKNGCFHKAGPEAGGGGGGGAGGGGGGGAGRGGGSGGGLTATEQSQVDASVQQFKSLPNAILRQRAVASAKENLKESQKIESDYKKAIKEDRQQLKKMRGNPMERVIRERIERREEVVAKQVSYQKVLNEVFKQI